ncbi:MAG TPA: copper homeostasis protein CutC [Terriglobia bacterium]|nr:copper homeostasis protein CutC [Terriglobia bacterium]
MNTLSREAPRTQIELEVIACSLDDAVEAYHGGASRLEVTVRLDQAGLTPPLDMVREIIQKVPLPVRVMLRDRPDFSVDGNAKLDCLNRKAVEFAALSVKAKGNESISCSGGLRPPKSRRSESAATMQVEGLVTGHVKDSRLDLAALDKIISAAPSLRVTVHHAIEATSDPIGTLRALRTFPNVDRALVSGGVGRIEERIERLLRLREAFGPERSLIAGGNLTLEMLCPLRDATGIRIFHLGRAVRTPEKSGGRVDSAKVRMAADLLGAVTNL